MSSPTATARVSLLLAVPLLLSACQPVVQALEGMAERNNAQLAQHEGSHGDRRAIEAESAGDGTSSTEPAASVPMDRAPTGGAAAPDAGLTGGSAAAGDPAFPSPRSTERRAGSPPVVYAEALPSRTPPPTATADPYAAAGLPVRLEIPAIQVDASIESVGLTSQGAMDVPKGWMNAAWYNLGIRPGEAGNAVIAGHLDSSTGGPAVFWDLHLLQPGDLVHVSFDSGLRVSFQVEGSQVYQHDADTQVIESIFGPGQTADLNLITCMGDWDYGSATYAERLVVFTRRVDEAAAP